MFFKILLVLFILIIIIFIVTFINKKYTDFVQEHSLLLKKLNEINNNYHFKDVDEFIFRYYYDNEDFYNDIYTNDYLTYELVYK